MARQFLHIRQGDADTLTETITGLSSLSGYSAKMYIYSEAGTLLASVSGTINALVITYNLVNETTKLWATGTYYFETKIWDSSDHVYTPTTGMIVVEKTQEEDPS
jgi:hypothetical protein